MRFTGAASGTVSLVTALQIGVANQPSYTRNSWVYVVTFTVVKPFSSSARSPEIRSA